MSTTKPRRRILEIGVVLLAAFGLLAIVLRQRSSVTLPEGSARGLDPITLVASDLAAAREDLGELGTLVGEKLQALYDELERSALERDAETRQSIGTLGDQLAALSSTLETNARQVSMLEAALRELRQQSPDGPESSGAADAPATLAHTDPADHGDGDSSGPVPPTPFDSTSTDEPGTRIAVPLPDPGAEPTASPAPGKSFLAFQLPSQSFAFEERQSLAILPQLSRVGFDAKSTLHDFSGVTSAIEGELDVCLARPGEGCSGRISVRAGSLDTGLDKRDETMREVLDVASFPEIRFDWIGFTSERVDGAHESLSGTAVGRMTIHGTTREISMPVQVAVDSSKRVSIEGECRLKLSDYGVEAPSQLGLISMEDEVALWVALRARSLGMKKEGSTR